MMIKNVRRGSDTADKDAMRKVTGLWYRGGLDAAPVIKSETKLTATTTLVIHDYTRMHKQFVQAYL